MGGPQPPICSPCMGSGYTNWTRPDEKDLCRTCGGSGRVHPETPDVSDVPSDLVSVRRDDLTAALRSMGNTGHYLLNDTLRRLSKAARS